MDVKASVQQVDKVIDSFLVAGVMIQAACLGFLLLTAIVTLGGLSVLHLTSRHRPDFITG